MKALIYTNPKETSYKDVEDPKPKNGEVLIEVKAAGICGSDIHAYLGHDDRRPAPLILGHEAAGIVLDGNLKGKAVAINPIVVCGRCRDCIEGRTNLCTKRQIISMPPRQGAFAQLLSMPESNLLEVPEGMNLSKAALTEPVATAVHAVFLAHNHSHRPLAEGRVMVMGAGAVGLSSALVLAHHGCEDIVIAETSEGRRNTARKAGFYKVFDPLNEKMPSGGGVDVVIDAVGAKATRMFAIEVVKQGGVIVHVGLLDGSDGIDVRRLTLQEISFIGSYTYTMADFKVALDSLHKGWLGELSWYEERPLSDGDKSFQDLINNRTDSAKIILKPE